MKIQRSILIIVIVLVLCIFGFFVYTRFCMDKYKMSEDGNTLIMENSIYTLSDSISISDEDNLGKTIGIAVEGKRVIRDYIWPVWVIEYRDDKEHNRIFVRGLMDLGRVYIRGSSL